MNDFKMIGISHTYDNCKVDYFEFPLELLMKENLLSFCLGMIGFKEN